MNNNGIRQKIEKTNYIMMITSLTALVIVCIVAIFSFKSAYGKETGEISSPVTYVIRIVIVLVVVAMAVYLLNQYYSKKMVEQITRPIDLLLEAANRIENNQFDIAIKYSGDKEFEILCNAFNHMQEHLMTEKEKSSSYEKARIAMIAGISHDLRTPLTSIKGYIGGLKDGIANTPEKQVYYLETAYKKASEMEVLLSRLLYFSKLETGNLPNEPAHIDLYEMLGNYVEEIGAELKIKNIEITFENDSDCCAVFVDVSQMLRVMDNLISNSMKYAKRDRLKIKVQAKKELERVIICFKDNGEGVDEEKIPHLFELFYRGDAARGSKKSGGSGLGLYIVKYIIESHNGTIKAYNDNGFVVEISLPIEEECSIE